MWFGKPGLTHRRRGRLLSSRRTGERSGIGPTTTDLARLAGESGIVIPLIPDCSDPERVAALGVVPRVAAEVDRAPESRFVPRLPEQPPLAQRFLQGPVVTDRNSVLQRERVAVDDGGPVRHCNRIRVTGVEVLKACVVEYLAVPDGDPVGASVRDAG